MDVLWFNNRHSNQKNVVLFHKFQEPETIKKSQINLVLAFILLQFNHILIDGYIWVCYDIWLYLGAKLLAHVLGNN